LLEKQLHPPEKEGFAGRVLIFQGLVFKGEQWHGHVGKGANAFAINLDGSLKHGNGSLTNSQADFLRQAGWNV
jgi:hypothetical protein